VWARDWAPLSAIGNPDSTNAGKTVMLDFNYYSARPGDDVTPRSIEMSTQTPRVSVPVYNEGGNFMIAGDRHCMMSTRVSEANSRLRAKSGDTILNDEEIKEYYKQYAGCREVTIFPRMPYEGTGHIDMWVKALDAKTLIVNRLDKAVDYSATQVQSYLNDRASELETMGYNVVRIPMPEPVLPNGAFRSYTNSLVLNGTALVPVYRVNPNGRFTDMDRIADYEKEVAAAYTAAGYRFVPIESTDLIIMAGAVHCVTMQLGAK
jgi:agmatine/peptidylarginine deiminase